MMEHIWWLRNEVMFMKSDINHLFLMKRLFNRIEEYFTTIQEKDNISHKRADEST